MSQAAPRPRRIDVHHHLAPPAYVAAMAKIEPLSPPVRQWTPQQSIEEMERAGVAVAITSISQPGVWFGDVAQGRALARACNDYAARLAADHPGRFGNFAAVPLPDVEGSLREIEYALDVLKADGIGLLTSYDNRWLGDAAFAPVMEELNRRKALVYTHPLAIACCRNLIPEIADSTIEFATDTTRTIASLLFSGAAARYRDIRFIFSHAGGTLPFLIERITRIPLARKDLAPRVPQGALHEVKRFYYDIAQAAHPLALAPLAKLVDISQILFGSDFPFRSCTDHVQGLAEFGFSPAELRAIERENAAKLMPRWKA